MTKATAIDSLRSRSTASSRDEEESIACTALRHGFCLPSWVLTLEPPNRIICCFSDPHSLLLLPGIPSVN